MSSQQIVQIAPARATAMTIAGHARARLSLSKDVADVYVSYEARNHERVPTVIVELINGQRFELAVKELS